MLRTSLIHKRTVRLILSKTIPATNQSLFQRRVQTPPLYYCLGSYHSFSTKKDNENKPTTSDGKNLLQQNTSKSQAVMKVITSIIKSTRDMIANPRATWEFIKHEANHYWVGTKLLWSEMKLTGQILGRILQGHEMSRRERRQLIRTTMDMFRLVPFAVFVIVPFMEFLLPFALKIFPNMLPSTFRDHVKKEEDLRKELTMRLAVAQFFQETMQELANKKQSVDGKSNVHEILDFVERAKLGKPIPNEKVIQIAKVFRDELTLANITRPQLVSMCRYMGLQTYGSDDFLRFQLRNKLRAIKEDDRRILWEGVDSLNTLELREACQERGMRSVGLTQFKLKSQLHEWLELSTQKNIPIALLIMSRAFQLTNATDEPEDILKSSMSSLDLNTINEVLVESSSVHEEDSLEMRKRKLESFKFQKEVTCLTIIIIIIILLLFSFHFQSIYYIDD
jgi:LETM1 and EF-hand domain-containing protein 1, mitochondrial